MTRFKFIPYINQDGYRLDADGHVFGDLSAWFEEDEYIIRQKIKEIDVESFIRNLATSDLCVKMHSW